ncbi:hypothetical protein E1193_06240 [Micromonospora sp. KC606]|uniref:DUF6194 family protein n=1 Tax=Micromonospora sp. KC606 TaxID=2530379 RepID=UPI001044B865|nr:DUF6194 family protein [Micromonospora sp. KC606]TDC84322.1 hypothetical protein E1193_06240 [Micromonospora sp. KC606]
MTADEMIRYIHATFAGVDAPEAHGDTFFIYDPQRDLPDVRRMPFATIVTGDHEYDNFSALDRPGAWRLSVGLTRDRYAQLFPTVPVDVDHHAVDTLLPHPVYAPQHWVCVVAPGENTADLVRELLVEAYAFAVRKYDNHRRRKP